MGLKDWCVVVVIASTAGFIGMTFAVISPLLPLIIEHFGGAAHGNLIGQWILAVPSIGIMIGGPTMGWTVERLGTRRVLLGSFAIYGLAGAAGLFTGDPYLLLGTRLILGIAAAGQTTAGSTMVAEVFATGNVWRGRVLGLQVGCGSVISVAATLAAGALGQSQGWRAPFELYLVSLTMLVLGAIVLPAAPRPQPTEPRSAVGVDVGVHDLLPLLPFYGLVIGTFLIAFFTAGTVPRLLALDGFSNPVVISRVIGAAQILLISGSFSYGWIRERIGVRWTFVLGLGLQGAGVLWIANAHGVLSIGVGTALLNLGSGIQYPNLSHLLIDHAPAGIRGRAVGLKYTAQFMGPFLATLIFVPLMNVFGIRNTMAVVGGILAAVVLATTLRVSRRQVVN